MPAARLKRNSEIAFANSNLQPQCDSPDLTSHPVAVVSDAAKGKKVTVEHAPTEPFKQGNPLSKQEGSSSAEPSSSVGAILHSSRGVHKHEESSILVPSSSSDETCRRKKSRKTPSSLLQNESGDIGKPSKNLNTSSVVRSNPKVGTAAASSVNHLLKLQTKNKHQ